MTNRWRKVIAASVVAVALGAVLAPPVQAKKAEPTVAVRAWYWEEAETEEFTDPAGNSYTIETPNPFCPSAPGSLGAAPFACAEGRLPIEIQEGDYETPNKISAVNFDLSLVPIGSEVSKFTVRFLEAKSGCYDGQDNDDQPNSSPSDWCEQTAPINIDGKQLQACKLDAFFGDGDARPYREAPKYTCVPGDPTAKRKEQKAKGDEEPDHVWTFDLTAFAKEWITEFTTNTSIMLVGKTPKGYDPQNNDAQDNWRVVLMGPKAPGGKQGFEAEIVFEPGEEDVFDIPPPAGTGVGTGTGAVATGTGTGFGSTGTGAAGTGDLGTAGAGAPTDAVAPSPGPLAAEGAEASQAMPGYVWLAILAGLIGFSLVRSIVVESATGIRPDGVLAQIQRLNAARRGAGATATATAEPGAFVSFMSGVGDKVGSLLGKLKLTRKG